MRKLMGSRWVGIPLVLVVLAAAYFVPRTDFVRAHRFGFIASCLVVIAVLAVSEGLALVRGRNRGRKRAAAGATKAPEVSAFGEPLPTQDPAAARPSVSSE